MRPHSLVEARAEGRLGRFVLISVLIHILLPVAVLITGAFNKKKTPQVPIFELVEFEKPKIRPIKPKVKPPESKPEPEKLKEAPKLTSKPEKPPEKKKPEPKKVKTEPDTVKVAKEVLEVHEDRKPEVVLRNVSDARLSFWASRVKKKAETLWNPPAGIDIFSAKVVVGFRVLREGAIENPRIAESSGNETLDEVALRTIMRMDKTPPIPPHYPEDIIEVGMEFKYQGQ